MMTVRPCARFPSKKVASVQRERSGSAHAHAAAARKTQVIRDPARHASRSRNVSGTKQPLPCATTARLQPYRLERVGRAHLETGAQPAAGGKFQPALERFTQR